MMYSDNDTDFVSRRPGRSGNQDLSKGKAIKKTHPCIFTIFLAFLHALYTG